MIVGIDLGTTHSLSGISSPDGGRLFPNPHGDLLTPSVISVDGDSVLVGQAACDRLVSHPEQSIAGFKRWMGTSRETRLGDRTFRPEELSALVLRALVADAEAATGQTVTEAVISVPAYFSDAQRKATRAAGELAGIRVERLINEPTAAALAYGLQQREGEGRFLVLDLGGGTFDVSILELFDGVVEVHASAGDNFLGGEDFLELLVETFARDSAVDMAQLARREAGQLRRRLEAAKRALTGHQQAEIQLQIDGRSVQWQIEEARFAQLAEPLMQRMRTPIERAMRDARLTPDKLDEIVLVGGATRMPMVSRLVTRMFGRLPLRHINPDQTVALGATVAAGLKARDEHLSEVILTDVCPYTLGTQVTKQSGDGQSRGGFFHPIIQRNSAVPVSREDEFYPVSEGQRQLMIEVYQGESPLVANNIKLGALQLAIDTKLPKAQNGVTVRFTYDINGLLQVEARVHASGQRHELVLEQNPGLLDAGQIAERLAALSALKIHPRDQQQNLALVARAERIYEEHLHHRERVQDWLMQFRTALDSQDLRLIADHRGRLAEALQSIEAEG
ncbi:molecular chaperone HscC [Luteimonas terrae]|uniref:Molecular chaperone HscC n=1 Tax=Luteimonas terrae TaxID=1530191 RepID=A0ABU1XTB7_9GAMM|nr:molecular chaperone HscC [Luteimonas terrae]MDR7192004.1 molecular chaperone HscC [Luteimonas terrae]